MINLIRQHFTNISLLIMTLLTLFFSFIFGLGDVFSNFSSLVLLILFFTLPIGTTIIEFLLTLLNIIKKPPVLNKYLHPIFEFVLIIIAGILEAFFYYSISTNFRNAFSVLS